MDEQTEKENMQEELADSIGKGSGVEREDVEQNFQPFDPQKVSLFTKPLSASDCIKRLEQGTLLLSPDFQRNEVWDKVRKSRLIESLMLKIPLPMFYVASDELENYQVVDGLQRLSTLRDFVSKKTLKLEGLEFWADYNGKTFEKLPPHLQNRITEATFTFTIINPGTPERVKRDVFKRINTGGLPLTDQEIRHALYTGPSTIFLNELVRSAEFLQGTDRRVNDTRMAGRELILRFLSFLIRDPKDYGGYTMDDWLSHTMQIINAMKGGLSDAKLFEILRNGGKKDVELPKIRYIDLDKIRKIFFLSMKRAFTLFKEYAFRKSLPSASRSPINKGLFEVWSVVLGSLEDEEFAELVSKKDELYKRLQELYDSDKFYNSISRDSHKSLNVHYRYQALGKVIDELIEEK